MDFRRPVPGCGATDLSGALRQIDMAMVAGVNLIDTADVRSDGMAEEILGEALQAERDGVLLASSASIDSPRRICR